LKFYNSVGPNPKIVRMFIAEKGLTIDTVEVDVMGGENRRSPYKDEINRMGQVPALQLDDGQVINEVVAICEYLEELHPKPSLLGATPTERAEARMWARRIDLNIVEPVVHGFRGAEGRGFFETRLARLLSIDAASQMKAMAADQMQWVNDEIKDGEFLAGPRFTLADIMLFCVLQFGSQVGQAIPDSAERLRAWYERVAARPSASA
jgi:glutathione S-transferase